jgi:protein-L-isoaspartate O-methyltransferase
MGGNAIAPVGWIDIPQDLILLKKREKEIRTEKIEKVFYMPLRGKYGFHS